MLSWFSNGVYSLAISTDSGLLSLNSFWMGKGKVGGPAALRPLPPLLWSPDTSLSPTCHHHCHTVAHTDRQLSDKILQIPSCLPVCVFGFFFFFKTAITTTHITVVLDSFTYIHTIALFSPLFCFQLFFFK